VATGSLARKGRGKTRSASALLHKRFQVILLPVSLGDIDKRDYVFDGISGHREYLTIVRLDFPGGCFSTARSNLLGTGTSPPARQFPFLDPT